MDAFVRVLAALLLVISQLTLLFISLTAQTHLLCRSEPNSFAGAGWGAMDFFPLSPNDSTVRCYEGWVLMS